MSTLVRKNGKYYPTIFDSVFGKNAFDHFFVPDYAVTMPPVNVIENENAFKIEVAAPGFRKEDFKVSVAGDKLTIASEIKSESEVNNENYKRREFTLKAFSRSFTLTETIDVDGIEAAYEAGILVVTLPKKELAAANSTREIAIA